jgi:hypothetical protein
MTEREKSFLFAITLCILIFGIPYLWRRNRDNDIRDNSKYAFAKIIKKTNSLKNGHAWHYDFLYKGEKYKGRWPTHVDYNVKIGDYFIVNFSSKDPDHNKPIYDYKLKQYKEGIINQVWDTIPQSLTISAKK